MGGKKKEREQTNSDVNLTHSSFAFTMKRLEQQALSGMQISSFAFLRLSSSVTSLWNITLSQPFLQRFRMPNLAHNFAMYIKFYL